MSTRPDPGAPPRSGPRARSTKQFQAVLDQLSTTSDFRSAQDIHAALRVGGTPVGLATVYRALQTLVEADQADLLRTTSGESMYRACRTAHHHHHLVCRSCHTTVEIEGPAVERWATSVAQEHGFGDVSHTIELFGLCPVCQAAARA